MSDGALADLWAGVASAVIDDLVAAVYRIVRGADVHSWDVVSLDLTAGSLESTGDVSVYSGVWIGPDFDTAATSLVYMFS